MSGVLANTMWQAQEALHGKNRSVALPVALMVFASLCVAYCHANDEDGGDPTKHFLALIVVQMLPLIFLEINIWNCADPIGMLSQFGTKVLMMHAAFLLLRLLAWPFLQVGVGACNLVGFVAVCAALHYGFGASPSVAGALWNLDILGLVLLALATALFSEGFHMEDAIAMTTNYIEILAFVPAVWMIHKSAKKGDLEPAQIEQRKLMKQAFSFFTFLVAFYVMEDLVSAFVVVYDAPLACVGHIVHFLVLLDFACFLLAHVYNPDKLHEQLMKWLPASCDRWV